MKKLVYLLSIVMVSQVAIAESIQCPESIKTQQSMKDKVNGWDVFIAGWSAGHALNGVTFFDAHPKEEASLAPDNEDKKDNKLVWSFKSKNQIWFACRYIDTKVQLLKMLPNTFVATLQRRHPQSLTPARFMLCG